MIPPGESSYPTLESLIISEDVLSIAVPEHHTCSHLDSIYDLSVFNDDTFLSINRLKSGDVYENYFIPIMRSRGLKSKIEVSSNNVNDLLVQVAGGRGIALVPFSNPELCHCTGIRFIKLQGGSGTV